MAAVVTRVVASETVVIVVATVVTVVMATNVAPIVVEVAVAMVSGRVVAVGQQMWLQLLLIRLLY